MNGRTLKLLAVGDVVGSPGRRAIRELLPALRESEGLSAVIVNAENAAGGSGLTPDIVREVLAAGCDCITAGDHVYKNRAIMETIASEPRLLRPANLAAGAPGRGFTVLNLAGGLRLAVVNLIGRAYIGAANNPFECAERVMAELRNSAELVAVEIHGEATAEKVAIGRFLDGRAVAVWGTHTHVQTADEQLLAGGTGYITDLGMTGGHDGIIGRRAQEVIEHLLRDIPTRWQIATGDVRLSGAIFTIDPDRKRCLAVRRVQIPLAGGGGEGED